MSDKATQLPNPTEDMIVSAEFKAIWEVIKGWDIKTTEGQGYSGANGSHVAAILEALAPLFSKRGVEAINWISSELAGRADANNGNAPDWFLEPPEWLDLWEKALEETGSEE